jgi:putative flippase GtrA
MSAPTESVLRLARRLRSPESGLPGLAVRFALAGGFGVIVYVLTTTLAAEVADLPFQVALGLGFYVALSVNFVSQRHFVWVKAERYALPIRRQAGRFVLLACVQYGLTALGTLLLPRALGLPTEVVYLAMIAALSLINFLLLRDRIFHTASTNVSDYLASERACD